MKRIEVTPTVNNCPKPNLVLAKNCDHMELYSDIHISVPESLLDLQVIVMLLDSTLANTPAPQEIWLDALNEEPSIVRPEAPEPTIPKSRVRRLRRMQSQNFIERVFYNVEEIFGMHRASA